MYSPSFCYRDVFIGKILEIIINTKKYSSMNDILKNKSKYSLVKYTIIMCNL